MRKRALVLGMAAVLTVSACTKNNGGANGTRGAQTSAAQKAAGNKTIAMGLAPDSRFIAVARAAGLDQTLAGPGPYTVLAPNDAAFAKLPGGTFEKWTQPGSRAQLTGVLTYLILPGTVLSSDIAKAIDNAKGKAMLATMSGGTLTAIEDGGKIVLIDGAGNKATVTQADDKFSNGVVHHIDTVLMPEKK